MLASPQCPDLLSNPESITATSSISGSSSSSASATSTTGAANSNAALVNQPIFSSIGLFVGSIVVAGFLLL